MKPFDTIREALDELRMMQANYSDGDRSATARAALDSLETELLRRDALHGREVGKLEAELATLRARLAPTDSTPGDERLLRNTIAVTRLRPWHNAHLRSQQPETEEQRAAPCSKAEAFEMSRQSAKNQLPDVDAALAKARDAEGGKS